MKQYVSTKGGVAPVDFEQAVMQGYAADGGLFVPENIPRVGMQELRQWANLGFVDLAFEILRRFAVNAVVSDDQLKKLLHDSFSKFDHPDIIPVVPLGEEGRLHVMELFHGPTLSFKDVAMGVLINSLDFFLRRKDARLTLLVATTGDTGPAAAYASAGKETLDCWVLYPRGMISEEQARQMTTIEASNVHALAVDNCPNGGDDLDLVVAELFADEPFKQRVRLSSVNSINWCRVMVQAVPYFYGYFKAVDRVGEKVIFSVPSGAFGNLFGGYLARAMGLPVEAFICANNANAALHTVFSSGKFALRDLKQTVSSAIDIVAPYNFWRYLYFACGRDHRRINQWMAEYQAHGQVQLDPQTAGELRRGFTSASITDAQTLAVIAAIYRQHAGYLLDPHAAVAMAAIEQLSDKFRKDVKVICLATAHPAKFPEVIRKALDLQGSLPEEARHNSIETAKNLCQRIQICSLNQLGHNLRCAMESYAK